MSRGWLVVFAKAPREGLVKTRMSPPLSLVECAALYAEMLDDVLFASAGFAERLDLEPIVAVHPPDAAAEIVRRVPAGFRVHAQRGSGLAERMAHATLEAGAAGAGCIVIRGSDSPAFPFEILAQTIDRLDSGDDLVVTPDHDGGYAAIAFRRPEPRVFGVEMSTSTVLEETLARARRLGLTVGTTPPVLDLDTIQDLSRFRQWLASPEGAGSSELCPRTLQLLEEHHRLTVP